MNKYFRDYKLHKIRLKCKFRKYARKSHILKFMDYSGNLRCEDKTSNYGAIDKWIIRIVFSVY